MASLGALFTLLVVSVSDSSYAHLAFELDPADYAVRVTIDEVRISSEQREFPLRPGRHTFTVERPGYGSAGGEVTLVAGQHALVPISLTPLFPTSGSYFAGLPRALQESGQWLTLEYLALGGGVVSGEPGRSSVGVVTINPMHCTLYGIVPWWPFYVGVSPLTVAIEPGKPGASDSGTPFERMELWRTSLIVGLYWIGYDLLVEAGIHGSLIGSFRSGSGSKAGVGWGADGAIAYLVSEHWALRASYAFDAAQESLRYHTVVVGPQHLFNW
jgi:hypothetical protein